MYELGSGSLYPLPHGFDPALSPDGNLVAFTRDGGENGVYVINVDGSGERKVFGDRSFLRAPKWSPDGAQIMFVRGDDIVNCWRLPDGRCVNESWLAANKPGLPTSVLQRDRERNFRLARVDLSGENYQDIPSLQNAVAPDWTTAGIVYQSKAGIQLTDINVDESRLVTFDILKQYYHDPDWQPNNGRIVFQRREASHWEIFAVNPDGSGLVALTRPLTTLVDALPSNVSPAFSPDGQYIAYLSSRQPDNEEGPWGVWVMRADGSHQRRLAIDLPFEYGYAGEQIIDWGP